MGYIARPRVGRVYGTGVEVIRHYPVNGAATPKNGDLVVLTAGLIVVCASDPASILGVVQSKKLQKAGYDMADAVTQVQDRDPTIGVSVTSPTTLLAMPVANGVTINIAPVAANVGVSYGTILNANGIFYLNIVDTASPTMVVVDIDIETRTAFCMVLASAQQSA